VSLKLTRTADPAADVVTDAEQKTHAKIDLTDDDTLVGLLNDTAIKYVEDRLQRGFVDQTWELSLDAFPESGCPIQLFRSPVSAIDSISYIDTDGNSQTLATSKYVLDDKIEPCEVVEAYQQTWPSTRDVRNAVTVTFTVGYGATAASTPEIFKTIIKQYFNHLYEHREPMKDKKWVEIPEHLNALLDKYDCKMVG
jgi:uncharacterized phiE125 gp8 family phage protein